VSGEAKKEKLHEKVYTVLSGTANTAGRLS
jgi:hypothetical protein